MIIFAILATILAIGWTISTVSSQNFGLGIVLPWIICAAVWVAWYLISKGH